jgi:hypothetical protein
MNSRVAAMAYGDVVAVAPTKLYIALKQVAWGVVTIW